VQGILGEVWSTSVEITGRYDRATADAVRTVLAGLRRAGASEVTGDLADQPTWAAFLDATTRQGARPA
jgi:hypothetical protein